MRKEWREKKEKFEKDYNYGEKLENIKDDLKKKGDKQKESREEKVKLRKAEEV